MPFEVPDSWVWVKHNDVFEISGGSQPPKSNFIEEKRQGYIRLYQIRDYGTKPIPVYIPIEYATKQTKKGDILLARYGASLGKVFIAEDGAYNVAMAKVIPLINDDLIYKDFIFILYQSSLYMQIISLISRTAQAGFNKEDLSDLQFPFPPISEQKRIVNTYNDICKILNSIEESLQ